MSSLDKQNSFQFANSNSRKATKSSSSLKDQYSPLRLLVTSIITILVIEVVALVSYEHLVEGSALSMTTFLEVFFVSLTLLIVIPPLVYIFSYRPLILNMRQLQRTESELELLATALHSADHGIVITDNLGNIEWSNPAFVRTTGVHSPELTGQNLRLIDSKLPGSADDEKRWETILSGQVWKEELNVLNRDGRGYIKEQIITPVRNASGEISHLIFIEKDVTEQRRLEKTTETLAISAQALNQSLHLDDVLATLLDLVMGCMQYANAAIVLLHHETRWTVRAYRGPEFSEKFRHTDFYVEFDVLENPHIQKMLASRQTVVIPETAVVADSPSSLEVRHGQNCACMPLIVNNQIIGFCIVKNGAPHVFSPQHLQATEALVNQAAGAIENARLFEQVEAGRERLKSLSHRLVEIQETERRYIARELHDEAGQALASLKIQLLLLGHQAPESDVIKTKVPEIQQQVDDISENLHRLAAHLRPASLDHVGMTTALSQHVQTISQQYNLIGQFEACGFEQRLPLEMETAVYRIVQEALTNVVRHAQATRVDVFLKQKQDHFVIIVEDDGKGFDPLNVMAGIVATEHLGLIGIRERTEMLGGKLTIDSSIGNGTTLKIEVPYDNSRPTS